MANLAWSYGLGTKSDSNSSFPMHSKLSWSNALGRLELAQRFRMTASELTELGARLSSATPAELARNVPVSVRDPNDEHILAAAIGSNADYLVTGDKDLLTLADDPRLGSLKIVTAAQFLDALE